jgi:hypothetical protein
MMWGGMEGTRLEVCIYGVFEVRQCTITCNDLRDGCTT